MRGPKVFKGYWQDPDATAAAFAGGWLRKRRRAPRGSTVACCETSVS